MKKLSIFVLFSLQGHGPRWSNLVNMVNIVVHSKMGALGAAVVVWCASLHIPKENFGENVRTVYVKIELPRQLRYSSL